ncbi:MAG: hypothetical protein H0S80_11575 [Desulfovibrionaceae bacterium]|nr:hypothetical protein [Desulfovibrionaceae bacterium]
MTHKEAVETIASIEREFDVTGLSFQGDRVWPLVRQRLWGRLINPHLHETQLNPDFRRDVAFPLSDAGKRDLEAAGNRDVLFYAHPSDTRETIHDRRCNPHLDPLIDLLPKDLTHCKIEPEEGQSFDRLLHPALPIKTRMQVRGPFPGEPIAHFDELNRLIAARCPFSLDHDLVAKDALVVRAYRELFETVLDMINPQALFETCYYHPPMNGLAQACRSRSIPCVDVQHGKQGRFHGAYTHWTFFPKDGWDMLPSHNWCWGEPTQCHIEQSRSGAVNADAAPKAVVGGFPWLGLWLNGKGPNSIPDVRRARGLAQGRTAILATLQPAWELGPDTVIRAIRNSPREWIWFIRAHPKQKDRMAAFKAQLEAAVPGRYELEQATRLPLYAMLRASRCHVTAYSTCCYEALYFNVPTVLWGERGLAIYGEAIKNNTFKHASTAEEIPQLITGLLGTPVANAETTHFIQTKSSVTSRALAEILRGPFPKTTNDEDLPWANQS